MMLLRLTDSYTGTLLNTAEQKRVLLAVTQLSQSPIIKRRDPSLDAEPRHKTRVLPRSENMIYCTICTSACVTFIRHDGFFFTFI